MLVGIGSALYRPIMFLFKKLSFVFFLLAVFCLSEASVVKSAEASTIYDNSETGAFYDVTTNNASEASYIWALQNPTKTPDGVLEHVFPTNSYFILPSSAKYFQFQVSEGNCYYTNVKIVDENGHTITELVSGTDIGNGICQFTFSPAYSSSPNGILATSSKIAYIAVCKSGSCNEANGQGTLKGSVTNKGNMYSGSGDFESHGSFAFKFCDANGCDVGGFNSVQQTYLQDTSDASYKTRILDLNVQSISASPQFVPYVFQSGDSFMVDIFSLSTQSISTTSQQFNVTHSCTNISATYSPTFGIFNPDGIAIGGWGCGGSSATVSWSLEQYVDDFGFSRSLLIDGVYTIAFFEDNSSVVTWDGVTPELDNVLATYPTPYAEIYLNTPIQNGVQLSSNFLIDTSEIISTISEKNPTDILFSISKRPETSFQKQHFDFDNSINGTSTATTVFTSLQDGVYDVQVKFSNFGCNVGLSLCPFPLSYIYSSFEISNGVVTNTGDVEVYNNITLPTFDNQYEDCGVLNIDGCISNAFRFLLIPSQSSIDAILSTKERMDSRIPFVYLSEIQTVADEVFNSSQLQSVNVSLDLGFGTIPFLNATMIENAPQASLIRQLISYILWFVFALSAYRIVLGVHNKDTI